MFVTLAVLKIQTILRSMSTVNYFLLKMLTRRHLFTKAELQCRLSPEISETIHFVSFKVLLWKDFVAWK